MIHDSLTHRLDISISIKGLVNYHGLFQDCRDLQQHPITVRHMHAQENPQAHVPNPLSGTLNPESERHAIKGLSNWHGVSLMNGPNLQHQAIKCGTRMRIGSNKHMPDVSFLGEDRYADWPIP